MTARDVLEAGGSIADIPFSTLFDSSRSLRLAVLRAQHLSRGITAFLDILGFSERILTAKTNKDVEGIVADIESIQQAFEFRTKDEYAREAQVVSKKTVLAFSDSVVVNFPLQSKLAEIHGTFDPVMSELSSMALAQGQCVASGFFLRGGVDIGW